MSAQKALIGIDQQPDQRPADTLYSLSVRWQLKLNDISRKKNVVVSSGQLRSDWAWMSSIWSGGTGEAWQVMPREMVPRTVTTLMSENREDRYISVKCSNRLYRSICCFLLFSFQAHIFVLLHLTVIGWVAWKKGDKQCCLAEKPELADSLEWSCKHVWNMTL